MVIIPVRPDLPSQRMQVVLDGTTYTLDLRWNGRTSSWMLDVMTEDASPIAMGLKVVVNFPLGARCVDPRFPIGRIIARDTAQHDENPDVDDLGDRVQLIYFTALETLETGDDDVVT